MKKLTILTNLFIALLLCSNTAFSQDSDSTGLPGDNFSLAGAIEMFKKASSPEEFEKLINTESNHVDNLDLDGDGETDYVKVVSKMDKDVHVFVLQVAVSATENQDIAVIELEKTGEAFAVLQILGDEDIYGEQVIIEATDGSDDGAFVAPKMHGPSFEENYMSPVVVNVWLWPAVRYVYRPAYRPWISPWGWRNYPGWWRPWRPAPWRVFHPMTVRYRPFCRVTTTHRVVAAHRVYTPYRSSSVVVLTRHAGALKNYRVTRTTKTITGPRGRKVKVTKTKVRRGRRG